MLFENASAELALLLFTLLVPVGVMALALMACTRGFLAVDGAAARAADRLGRFLGRHERGVHHEGPHPRAPQVACSVSYVEGNAVVDAAAAEGVGDHGELEALAIAQRVVLAAAQAAIATLVAGALAHERAVLHGHEHLASHDDDPEGQR